MNLLQFSCGINRAMDYMHCSSQLSTAGQLGLVLLLATAHALYTLGNMTHPEEQCMCFLIVNSSLLYYLYGQFACALSSLLKVTL